MKNQEIVLLPRLAKIVKDTGENIKLARLRRKLTLNQVAERAGIPLSTLRQVEEGDTSLSFGIYAQVLFVLSIEKDILKLAGEDLLGRKLQDIELLLSKSTTKE